MKKLLGMIKSMLTKNILLKISSLILATIIWMGVVNVDDPTKLVTIYNIPVTFTNQEIITDNSQIFRATTTRYVNIIVSGRRSVVKDLTANSFIATASLEELSITNSVPVDVAIKNKSLENKISIDSQSINQIQLEIEDVVTKTYTVEPVITGNVAMNYELGNINMGANSVDITAPMSKHNQISKAIVNVDVSEAKGSFKSKYKLVLLNQSGGKMSFGNDIVPSQKKFAVNVDVLKLVRVPVVVEFKGTLPDGYELDKIITEPTEITLSGKEKVVNEIESVIISGDAVDISNLKEDTEIKVDLRDYVPEGVSIREDSEVSVLVEIYTNLTKNIKVDPSEIELENVSSEYEAQIISENISFDIIGKDSIINNTREDDFSFRADCSTLTSDKGSVLVEITTPEGVEVIGTLKVKVKMTAIED